MREAGQTVEEDHATIRATHLNEAIDPGLFALASMGIARGTDISYSGKRFPIDEVLWDGEAIVPVDPKLARRGTTRPQVLMILAVGCAAIAALMIWWTFKPKPAIQ